MGGDGHLLHLTHRDLDDLVDHIGKGQQQAGLLYLLLLGIPHQAAEAQHHAHLVVVDDPYSRAADQHHQDQDQPLAVLDRRVDDGDEPL